MKTTTFSIDDMEALEAAILILKDKQGELCKGSMAVFRVLTHAAEYLEAELDKMVKELMGKGEK